MEYNESCMTTLKEKKLGKNEKLPKTKYKTAAYKVF